MELLRTDLKKYSWTYVGKQICLADKETNQVIFLNKVGIFSLARFILRSIDKMKLEENTRLRNELTTLKEKYRESIKEKKALSKQFKKESRHFMGSTSKNSSGE